VGGWLGKNNLGDEALFRSYQSLFPEFGFFQYDGGRLSSNIARRFHDFKAGILAGGTLIGQKKSWLNIANSFLEICPKLIIFGTGVEEPSIWPGEATINDWIPLLECCDFVGVRGPQSADLLMSYGIKQVDIVGDPVLTNAADHINSEPIPNSVGLNIGTADNRLWGSEEGVCEEMARLARIAKQAGWIVKWFVVWPKDYAITYKAASISGTESNIFLIYRDYKEFLARVRSLSAFVGMKLHATVLATCALTPSIMLEYQPKCRDYMKSIDREEATFRTDAFKADEIWDLICLFNNHHADASLALSKGIHSLRKKQKEFASKITASILYY